MKLHELGPVKGARHNTKRKGRGQGSGKGGTATRGHKGAQSRSGYKIKKHFEGGQMPIQIRLPKFGFKNHNRREYKVVNLSQLEQIATDHKVTDFNHDVFVEHGIMSSSKYLIKVLGDGELTKKVNVKVDAVSKSAREAIEGAGGSIEIIPVKEVVIEHNKHRRLQDPALMAKAEREGADLEEVAPVSQVEDNTAADDSADDASDADNAEAKSE